VSSAEDGYWLDQYNALLYLSIFRLGRELEQMQRQGASEPSMALPEGITSPESGPED
jgi:hypothetical protein